MEAWAGAIPDSSQTDLAREFNEGPSDNIIGQWRTLVGEKKAGSGRSRIKLIPPLEIHFELLHSGRVQRNQARLTELAQPNG
jgi:hypothetical protein